MSARVAGAWIAAALALGLFVGASWGTNTTGPTCGRTITGERVCVIDTPNGPRADPEPEEDEPGWNCAEMGNRRCGTEPTR